MREGQGQLEEGARGKKGGSRALSREEKHCAKGGKAGTLQ